MEYLQVLVRTPTCLIRKSQFKSIKGINILRRRQLSDIWFPSLMLLCLQPLEQVVANLLFLTINTYHMNVVFNTISLGYLLELSQLKLINYILDSL